MKRTSYTIIELLLVIAIAGILLSIAIPSFSRLLKGSGPTRAARELIGKINAARAYAVSNKTDVAIIFPIKNEMKQGSTTNEKEKNKELYTYASYRVCEVFVGTTSIEFKRWIPGENWTFLPSGVVALGKKQTNTYEQFVAPDTNDEKTGTNNLVAQTVIGFNEPNIKPPLPTQFENAIIFRTDGMLYNMQPVLIKIQEARKDKDSSGDRIWLPSNSDYLPLVVRFNGKVKAFNEVVTE